MEPNNTPISVFFSWQSDSSKKTNLNFIEECLKKSVKEIARENSTIIILDRDTKGVGGTPSIVDVIFKKIRSCDIFVWDATIINNLPRYTPNPNVLLELGYAFAVVGEGRIIGIMNEANGIAPDKLPFDLVHRRWPIRYKLDEEDPSFKDTKKNAKNDVIKILKNALTEALKEPKIGIIQSDIDFHTAKKLWSIIDSDWIDNWLYFRKRNIQYEKSEYFDKMDDYKIVASKPENQFVDENLISQHDEFIQAMQEYLWVAGTEMCPSYGNDKAFVINVKDLARQRGWIKNYDEMYDQQVEKLLNVINKVEKCWNTYILALRSKYPEITHDLQV
ncbi:MAG: nucleotide-binding protein [Desulfobacterales bacterium]|nr:nucleotide-binding protein [Desulfobacterales bacterium]